MNVPCRLTVFVKQAKREMHGPAINWVEIIISQFLEHSPQRVMTGPLAFGALVTLPHTITKNMIFYLFKERSEKLLKLKTAQANVISAING